MKIRSSKGNTFERCKHIPSGIILTWLGRDDDKIHTQSIAIQYPLWGKERSYKATLSHAQTELFLRQISQMRLGDIGCIPSEFEPIITRGLTRDKAKEGLLKELEKRYPIEKEVK